MLLIAQSVVSSDTFSSKDFPPSLALSVAEAGGCVCPLPLFELAEMSTLLTSRPLLSVICSGFFCDFLVPSLCGVDPMIERVAYSDAVLALDVVS